jgi:tRNA A37 threonylcarbamoyladenosine dehydratase
MAGKFHHERLYRGGESVAKLAAVPVTLCGAGALGSHLAENLARQGFPQLRVVDRD